MAFWKSIYNYGYINLGTGTPKWMFYDEKNIEMDDLGVPPFIESLQDGVWQGLVPSGVIWRWDLPEILEGDNSAKSEI